MTPPPCPVPEIVPIVSQSGEHADCAVAALAMFAGVDYATALAAFDRPRRILRGGAQWADVRRAARRLGLRTRLTRRYDLDEDTGLLYLASRHAREDDHMVFLWAGRVIDGGQGYVAGSLFCALQGFEARSLLVRVEDAPAQEGRRWRGRVRAARRAATSTRATI